MNLYLLLPQLLFLNDYCQVRNSANKIGWMFSHDQDLHCRHRRALPTSTLPSAKYNGDPDQGNSSSRTCLRYFLTQRAVQSFMYLLSECRDPHSADWIERFSESHNLLEFHGTGVFNTTRFPSWDSIILNMIQNPPERIIVQARRRGGGRGGWSKNNPYLQDRFVEYEISIDPPNLATRILSVREHITREMKEDLTLIFKSNEKSAFLYLIDSLDPILYVNVHLISIHMQSSLHTQER